MTSPSIPRLSKEELPPELAAMLRPRIEHLGEFFKSAAHLLAIEERDPSRAKFLSAAERAAQTLALAVLRRHGKGSGSELEGLVGVVGHAHANAVLMLVGQFVTHSLMVNALDLKPPVPSPL